MRRRASSPNGWPLAYMKLPPAGLGRWRLAWDHIGTPSDVFLDALADWEAEDTPSTRSKVEAASTDLIEAWAEAARRWIAAGRPSLAEAKDRESEDAVGELVS